MVKIQVADGTNDMFEIIPNHQSAFKRLEVHVRRADFCSPNVFAELVSTLEHNF